MATDAELEAKLSRLDARIARYTDDPDARDKLVDAYNERGRTLGRLRRFAEAETVFKRLIAEFDDDDDPQVHFLVALTRHDRVNYCLRAKSFGDALESAEQFLTIYTDDPPLGRIDLVIRTLRRKAVALWELQDLTGATEIYDALAADYGDALGERARLALVITLDEAGDLALDGDELQLAIHFYDAVTNLVGADEGDEDLQYYAACSTFSKAIALGNLERIAEANAIWQVLWNRYKDDPSPPWPTIAGDAHYNEASRLNQLGLTELATQVCEEILSRYSPGTSDAADAVIANAVSLLEVMIDSEQPPLQIVAAGQQLLDRIEDQPGSELRWEILDLLRLKYWWLLQAVRVDDAITVSEELLDRFEQATDPDALHEIGKSVARCAYSFLFHNRFRHQRRKPALKLAVLLVDLKNGSVRPSGPPAVGGPSGLLSATIDVRRKCRAQATRLYAAVDERLGDSSDERLASLALDSRLAQIETLLEGGHLVAGSEQLVQLTQLGAPAAEVFARRAEEFRDRGIQTAAGYKLLQAMALRETDKSAAEEIYGEAVGTIRGVGTIKARLLEWSSRLIDPSGST